jgi:hypothetical protein
MTALILLFLILFASLVSQLWREVSLCLWESEQ